MRLGVNSVVTSNLLAVSSICVTIFLFTHNTAYYYTIAFGGTLILLSTGWSTAYENIEIVTRSHPDAFPSALRQKGKTQTKVHDSEAALLKVCSLFHVSSLRARRLMVVCDRLRRNAQVVGIWRLTPRRCRCVSYFSFRVWIYDTYTTGSWEARTRGQLFCTPYVFSLCFWLYQIKATWQLTCIWPWPR